MLSKVPASTLEIVAFEGAYLFLWFIKVLKYIDPGCILFKAGHRKNHGHYAEDFFKKKCGLLESVLAVTTSRPCEGCRTQIRTEGPYPDALIGLASDSGGERSQGTSVEEIVAFCCAVQQPLAQGKGHWSDEASGMGGRGNIV